MGRDELNGQVKVRWKGHCRIYDVYQCSVRSRDTYKVEIWKTNGCTRMHTDANRQFFHLIRLFFLGQKSGYQKRNQSQAATLNPILAHEWNLSHSFYLCFISTWISFGQIINDLDFLVGHLRPEQTTLLFAVPRKSSISLRKSTSLKIKCWR